MSRKGTITQFSGIHWVLLDSPTTADLNSLHSLPNGTVWIVGSNGTALFGNEKAWKTFAFDEEDLLDVVAFSNAMYVAAGTRGLYRIDGESLVAVRDDIEANRLTSDGLHLYVSGGEAVHMFDGRAWHSYRYTLSI